MRDFQRNACYGSEHRFQWLMDNAKGCSVNLQGVVLQPEPETKFDSLASIQAYVDRVLVYPGLIAHFGKTGKVTVRERRGEAAAHYEHGRETIAINTTMTGWAMREIVVLHELAHHFAGPGTGHGPVFTAALDKLIETVIGPQSALMFAIIRDMEGVK